MIDTNLEVKIGDRILGKKTGQLVPSTVIGIMPFRATRMAEGDYNRWGELYPDFMDKHVVLSIFDEPQKTMSIDDCKKHIEHAIEHYPFKEDFYKDGLFNKMVQHTYESVPELMSVAYPIDDVEVL